MKKLILLLSVAMVFVSCGAKNKVNSGGVRPVADEIRGNTAINFEGQFILTDFIGNTPECGRFMEIRRECGGYIVTSNNFVAPEEFCNINQGENRSVVVTQIGNELKSEVRMGANRTYTNVLRISDTGVLTKITRLKSRYSDCVYKRR